MSVNLEKLEDSVNCSICLDRLTQPKILSCMKHTFCKSCLDNLLCFAEDGSATIHCPFKCEEITRLNRFQTTNDLSTNFVVLNVLECFEKERTIDICHKEGCERKVSFLCIKCSAYFCTGCAQGHSCNRFDTTKADFPIVFNDKTAAFDPICLKHNSICRELCDNIHSALVFPVTPRQLICTYCKYREHKSHLENHVSIDAYSTKKRKELEDSLDSFKRRHVELLSQQVKSDQQLDTFRNQLEEELIKRQMKVIKDAFEKTESERRHIMEHFDLGISNLKRRRRTFDNIDEEIARIDTDLKQKPAFKIFAEFNNLRGNIVTLESSLLTVRAKLCQMPENNYFVNILGNFEVDASAKIVPELRIESQVRQTGEDFSVRVIQFMKLNLSKLKLLEISKNCQKLVDRHMKRRHENEDDDENRRKILR